MKLARWSDQSGRAWVGEFKDGHLIPMAQPTPGDPDCEILALAIGARAAEPSGPAVSVGAVTLLPPLVRPPLIVDFATFESHMTKLLQAQGRGPIPPEWYETPVGFFSNPHRIFGPDDVITVPACENLDFELECAAVIGRELSNASVSEAAEGIAGYLVFNDWSARDIQRHEKKLGGGGPIKSKDFAHSIGPWLVTPDELPGGDVGRPQAVMTARVNGVEYSRGELHDMHFSFAELVSYLARDAVLRPGGLVGSGTCGTGCILELSTVHGADRYPWLRTGDVVELEIEGMGTLRSLVGPRPAER